MFKTGKFEVYFKHYPDEIGENPSRVPGETIPYCGRTECIITENEESIRDGSAFCGLNDRFDKAVGRKVALARALEGADKEFRTLIWTKYLEAVKRV